MLKNQKKILIKRTVLLLLESIWEVLLDWELWNSLSWNNVDLLGVLLTCFYSIIWVKYE